MKKRVLSLLMALTLCLTTLPTAVFADVTENGEGSGGTHYVAESGGTQYETVQEILDNMEEGEITLLDSVTEDLTVYAATTIHMNGHSITGNIDATDSLTLNGGTVDGTVTVNATGGTFTMTAPAEAEAAITGGLNVVSGSASVSGAKVGVKGTLSFDGTDMLISGAVKAVELDSAAKPAAKTLYGSATVNGDTAAEAGFDTDTYKVGGEIAKKLTNKQVGSTTPAAPSLTLTETSKSLTAGKTAVFTANYTGTDTLNAYVQGNAVNGYFTISQKNNGDGTYTVSVKIDEETPGGTYTLFVHEVGNTSVQASATITVIGLPDAAEVNGKQYKSLPRALAAAQDGDTVKLLANHVTDADALNALGEDFTFKQYASIVPVVTKTLTLDLNHKTVDYLEVGFTETNEETQKKETLATGNLTVTGEAAYGRISNLMFMAGALDIRSGEIGGSGCAGLLCDANSGSVTVSNGTVYGLTVLEGASVTVNGGSKHAGEWVVASGATLNITDGTFGEMQFTRNGTIAISGGTFQSIKSYIAEELQPLMSLLDTQKVHAFYKGDDVQDGNAKDLADVTVKEHTHTMVNNKCACGLSCTHKNAEGASTIGKDGKCTVCGTQFAAGIGETYYTDVPSALDAAADGQTVKLLANKMLPDGIYVSKTLTLDLNGHSLDGYSLNVGGLTATSQVRTGKLTVIDSSGGNGAVGVTVRDGGTLVFDPKNDHTTLLQLEVWGGTVKLYGGKISRSGLRLNNGITLGDLLPQKAGLAYYRGDTQLTLEEAAAQTCDLVVKLCSHGGKNGFDKNAATCPNCNAPAVAETALNNGPWRRFADLQTALDADRDGGAELTLLTDVTGDYTIDGTKDTGLNLNGHSIKGTVTVKGIKGDFITTTLSNTKNTTTASIDKVVAFDGAELAGSGKAAVIGTLTLAEGATWKTILNGKTLGYKVLNADGTHKWYAPDDVKGSQLNNVIINSLPITTKTLNLKVDGKNLTGNSPKVERGTTVQLCASCNTKGADVYIYTGEIVGNNMPTYSQQKATYQKIGTSWYYVVDLPCNTIGKYSVYFTATKDGYTVQSAEKKLTVTKPNLSNAEITFPDGNVAAFNSVTATGVPTFDVTYKGQTLEKDKDFTITGGDSFSGVGPCTLTIKATDNGDYTGSKSAQWNVRPLKVAASVGDIIKTYDGTTDLPKNTKITFKSADSYYTGTTLRLAKGTDYEVSNARYDSADAGQKKTVSFTIKLKNAGYVFEDSTTQKDFTLNGAELNDKTFKINPAAIDPSDIQLYQTVFNDLAKTYKIDLNQFLDTILPEGGKYGDIQYGKPSVFMNSDYYPVGGATIGNGNLSLSINKAASSNQGDEIGTVTVQVETTNYQPFTLTIHVSLQDKLVPVLAEGNTVSASEITYGQTLADSKLAVNGTMKDPNTSATVDGTFTWTDGTIKPDAGSYEAEWTFTPAAGYEKYATVTETVTIKVKPAELIVSVKASSMYYTGEEQIASIIASGQSVDSTPVTFTYSDKVDGNYTSGVPTFTDAGTYTAYYKAEAANHEPATGTFTVTIDPLPISLLSVSSISKTYDGSADVTLTADKLTFFSKTAKATNIKLPDTALTFSDAQFTSKQEDGSYLPSPEVGNGKALSFTMTLTSNNYVFEGKSEGTTKVSDVFATDDVNRFSITKAAAPTNIQSGTLTITNGLHKTYSFDLSTLLPKLTAPCDYGTITYDKKVDTNLGVGSFITLVNGKTGELTLEANRSGTDEGQFGTITVTISTSNYQDITLTVNIFAKNKIVPVLDGEITATPITYGDTLSKSEISGKMKDPNTGAKVEGTFSWQQPGDTILGASTSGHDVGWTFTPKDGNTYTEATGTVKVPVAPKSIEGAVITLESADLEYNAAEQSPKITGVALEKWTENITYRIVSGNTATNVNDSLTLTIEGTGNYTGKAAVKWKITPREVTPAIEVASCTYTGDALEPTVTLKDGNEVIPTDEYTVEYSNNTNAGTGRVTIKDVAGGNYVIKEKTQDFTITKAAAPTNIQSGTLTITNGLHKTYSLDLSALLPKLTAPCDYGTITYDRKVDTNLGVGSFITLVDGKTGELTLDANRSGTGEGQFGTITVTISTSNYQDITLTINVSAKNRITPTGTPTLSKNAITYGDALNTIALSGKLHDNVNNVDVDGTFEWVDGTHIHVVGNGTYAAEWIFEPTDTEKYLTVSGRSNITVEKATQYGKVSMAGYTYGQAPSTPTLTDRTGDANAQVTYRYAAADSGSVQTWDISNPPALNAGTYRMYASIGDTDNYYGFEAVYCEFVVAKATPTYTVPTGLTAKYGQTLADVTLPDGWSWMDSSESVGGASTAAKTFQAKFTPKDTENYNTVENIELEVTVNKADGGNLKTVELEQKYTDASDHTYTPDWAGLPAGQDWTFSSEASIVLSKQDFAADGSLLTYSISGGKAGDKITITLKASCDNYEDFTITLNVTLTEKDDQKPLTITGAGSVVYGQTLTLTTTGGSGTGTVTYRIDTDASTGEATIDPETGVLTPVKVGSVSVIATKAGDNDYNDVTSAPFVLMIKPATPTGEPNYTKITTSGKTLKDAALTTKGSTLNPSDGKLEWVDDKGEPLPDDTTVKANTTYKWRFTPDDDNYTTLTGEVELYHKSSSGGGWYDSYYTIKATAGTGGSISPSGSVSVREGRDQTFTITPDKSYAVSNVKIDGKSIGAVKSYTFENVRRPHTIEVIFMKANGNPQAGVFVDVATGSYYENAVDWAVGNGITQGTDATHFSPDGICTRAQAVTFLWRAAGSPKPETRTMPFTDVPVGSYYYDAVLWAVENGIAKGTSDTTFSPNMTCTRAQIVAFLWRSEKSPAAGTANPFADVKSTAYYADAVLWAVKEDITKGTTSTAFSPNTDCTRAQIVTFLWRCKK